MITLKSGNKVFHKDNRMGVGVRGEVRSISHDGAFCTVRYENDHKTIRTHRVADLIPACFVRGCDRPVEWEGSHAHLGNVLICHGDRWRLPSADRTRIAIASLNTVASTEPEPIVGVEEPHVLALCEVPHIFIKPNELYRFEVVEGCEKCKTAAEAAEGAHQ